MMRGSNYTGSGLTTKARRSRSLFGSLRLSVLAVIYLFVFLVGGTQAVEFEFDFDPIYDRIEVGEMSFWALRPFYSSSSDPEMERWRKDFLWPLYTRKGFKDEVYGRLLFFGYSADFSPDTVRQRNWLIPFLFQGTSAKGEGYFSVFPLGGTLREFLGRDEAWFFLFPLYAESRVNDVETTTALWPIYSRSTGEKVDRFRIWPFYGYSLLKDEFRKRFILWPFYNDVEYLNDRNPGEGFILFPFYGHVETEQAENYWVLPPFFRYCDSEPQRTIYAPWPFIQIADGKIHKRYVWPFYGRKRMGTLSKEFYAWPIVWNNRITHREHDLHRRRVVPFFVQEQEVANTNTVWQAEGDVLSTYWKLWPLMSWQHEGAVSRFRALELWPLRNTSGIERNWSPWWTLYRRERMGDVVDHHLLWGLYRQSKGSNLFEWSLLKGVAGYKKTQDGGRYRFLFMWFGEEESP